MGCKSGAPGPCRGEEKGGKRGTLRSTGYDVISNFEGLRAINPLESPN